MTRQNAPALTRKCLAYATAGARPLFAVVFIAALAACGGGGGSGPPAATTATSTAGNNIVVKVAAEPPGSHCAAGGKKVQAGADINGNGVLDAGEVTATTYVCNVGGAGNTPVLVALVAELPGTNCANGGTRVEAGLDANGNGVLDSTEIMSTAYVCKVPGLAWVSTSGSAVQAQSNIGYIVTNDVTPVTLTLPTNPAVGDLVAINGIGAGGWSIAQNAAQSINGVDLHVPWNDTWTQRTTAAQSWISIASSADGLKLLAADGSGQLYTSGDAGLTWTARAQPRTWTGVASSVDGSRLVALDASGATGGFIYISTDSGVTWTPHAQAAAWITVASSADGSKLVAAVFNGQIYTSTDSGVTWTAHDTNRLWKSVASSADGSKLVAAVDNGQIYTSADSGITWTARDASRAWFSVASSGDGTYLVAAEKGGNLYTSSDSGATWIQRETPRVWIAVASSSDGTKLIAADSGIGGSGGGLIYTSSDSGITWTPHPQSAQPWIAVASSADGSRLVAGATGGSIFTSSAWTTVGIAGKLSGGPADSVELQYLGSGEFGIVGQAGAGFHLQ